MIPVLPVFMKDSTDGNVEQLLHGAAFPNPAHREALRARLFEDARELDLDDLALVAGGAALPEAEPEDWAQWQEPMTNNHHRQIIQ